MAESRLLTGISENFTDSYRVTYNTLLKTYTARKAEIDKLKTGLQCPGRYWCGRGSKSSIPHLAAMSSGLSEPLSSH